MLYFPQDAAKMYPPNWLFAEKQGPSIYLQNFGTSNPIN